MSFCNEQQRINKYHEQKTLQEFNQRCQVNAKKKRQWNHKEMLAKKLFDNLPDLTKVEDKCYQNAVKEHAAKWEEQEIKRNDHVEELKKERIAAQINEMQTIKQTKEKVQHEHEVDKVKLQQNEKIDLIFYRQQYADRVKKAKHIRKIINQQIETNNEIRHDELITSRILTNQAINCAAQNDDKHFFNYANKLITVAKNKGNPIHPLKKVIDEYTVQHSLLPQSDDPPHMKSQIDIGISVDRKYSIK